MAQLEKTADPLLEVKDLRLSFVTRSGVVQAIDSVSFTIGQGETFGLVGETGCGKSQTAMAVMRLTPEAGIIQRGQILFEGMDLVEGAEKEVHTETKGKTVQLRRDEKAIKKMNNRMSNVRGRLISMIFQEPMTSLNPVYSIGFQISEVLKTHRRHYLLARVEARNLAKKEDLKSVAVLVSRPGYSDAQLSAMLQQLGLQALQDEIRFIVSRTDIGLTQKSRLISQLADTKTSPIRLRYLMNEDKASSSFVYRLLFRVPGFRSWVEKPMSDEAKAISLELLTQVRMPNASTVLNQHPHELSGGMRQRVMIAMGVAGKPKLVIADEPTSALDVTIQAQILQLFRELRDEMGMSVLFISHDMGVIAEICDRVGVMYAGNIVEVATVEELFANPKHPYTQGLLAAIPQYDDSKKPLQSIPGTVPNLINPPSGCRFRTRCKYAFAKCSETPPLVTISDNHQALCWLYAEGEKK
ncbi:MAG: ABC transporter ATP-binding protein [Thaumarchaeota archaeon]|nr:ABC transporter ATP-binding protein [Nitrososphaerota archaeon]